MTTLAKGPRLSREGCVPARNTSRSRKSAMAIPKTNSAGAPYGVDPDSAVAKTITDVTPAEKYALGLIVDSADLLETEDGRTYLVVPAEPKLMDALATVGSEREDLEDGGDYERTDPTPAQLFWDPTDASDDEPDVDDEPFLNYLP